MAGAAGTVRTERRALDGRGAVATITIAHGAKLNTLNPALMEAFTDAVGALHGDHDLRALVVTGEGDRAFIGGADITSMAALPDGPAARQFITRMHGCCRAVRDLPVPVIARIGGWTLGAGLELAVACDLRIASATARFGMPEVRVGLPSVIEAALLPALIGWGRTRRLLLLGERIDAATALDWGLVERVVPLDALDAAVAEWVAMLAEAGPQAIRLQKALIRQWEDLSPTQAIAAGIDCFEAAWATDEPRRMLDRFARRPR